LEVERKFYPSIKLKSLLSSENNIGGSKDRLMKSNAGVLSFEMLHESTVRDVYYDLDDQLSSKGIWRRRRYRYAQDANRAAGFALLPPGLKYQAKISLGGSYTASKFHEVEGLSEVSSLVRKTLPGLDMADLKVMADLETYRQASKVQNLDLQCLAGVSHKEATCTVVLDKVSEVWPTHGEAAPFMHEVGEVELVHDSVAGDWVKAVEMDRAIEELMVRHGDIFLTDPEPKGKLSAYFAWKAGKSSL